MTASTRPSYQYEDELISAGFDPVGGVDEAGRGPLAGPVVAASAILSRKNAPLAKLNDSKLLSAAERIRLFEELISNPLNSFSIGFALPAEIDQINILRATELAMIRAIQGLTPRPAALIIDAVKLNFSTIKTRSMYRADSLSYSVAAASIIAKVVRDRYMENVNLYCPGWRFDLHKGYGTQLHRDLIAANGPSEIHRLSFKRVREFVP